MNVFQDDQQRGDITQLGKELPDIAEEGRLVGDTREAPPGERGWRRWQVRLDRCALEEFEPWPVRRSVRPVVTVTRQNAGAAGLRFTDEAAGEGCLPYSCFAPEKDNSASAGKSFFKPVGEIGLFPRPAHHEGCTERRVARG